jgi:hypothetical protein
VSEELFLSIPSIYILGLFLSILLLGAQSLRLARKCQKNTRVRRTLSFYTKYIYIRSLSFYTSAWRSVPEVGTQVSEET